MHQQQFRAAVSARLMSTTHFAGLFATMCLTVPIWASAQQSTSPDTTMQAPSATPLEEVIVTARRREESVQDVPISVVVLNAAQLNAQGVTTANDLARVAPGLSIMNTAANSGAVTYSIRGQGSTFGSGPGVIAYFDDVPNFGGGGPMGGSPPLFDLSSVQVLKGPQGTLFGRNTTGGAVLFTPTMPSNNFNGYVDVRAGSYGQANAEFGLGGPIVGDALMFRLAGQSLNHQGYTIDVFDGTHLDNQNVQNVRGILTFRPTDNFDNTTLIQYTREHENGSGALITTISPEAANPLYPLLQPQLAMQQALGIRNVLGEFPYKTYINDTYGAINTTNWKLNDQVALKNIVSYLHTTNERNWDLDGTNLPILGILNPSATSEQYTEEFQVRVAAGPVRGQAGYYFEHVAAPFQYAYVEVSPILFGSLPPPIGPANAEAVAEGSKSISRGPYAQLDWSVTPQLTLTGGVRYTTDDLSAPPTGTTYINFPPLPPVNSAMFAYGPANDHTFNAFTWTAAADYAVNPDLNVYGHVSRGYKQGGFNGTAPPGLEAYQPEFVIDYELGFKGHHDFGGWRTLYAVDVFYDDYTNIQRDENVTIPPSNAVATIIQNAAAGYITGAEMQFAIQPSPYFELRTAYTYLYARYTKFNGGPGVGDVSSSLFPNTPTSQLTVTPIVTFPMPAHAGTLTAQATLYLQTSIATDAFNVPNGEPTVDLDVPGATAPGYTRYDFRIDWQHIMDSRFSVGLYALNAFNKQYVTGDDNQLNSLGFRTALYSAPAFYGVELRYEFGR
jgi:iron complex outermembrane recepter protein